MSNKKTFLTTTLPYINSKPHVGHLFEFILADAISRFLKVQGNDVQFNVGLDEHGLKVYTKAIELGVTPQEYISDLTTLWLDFCRAFHINYDTFYKTSDTAHHEKLQTIWRVLVASDLIYKGKYAGNYCLGCESFKLDKELINGKCPDHQSTELQFVEEEMYFFRLTNFKDSLLHWIETSPNFLHPASKRSELINLINDVRDIPVSRNKEKCPWGIEVPDDSDHVMYVWFDALHSYICSAGFLTPKFEWGNVIQICGADNLRFQAVIFQAFLQTHGIHKTNTLLVHGTILDAAGKKMSKSDGNVIDPIEQLNKYGLDAVRYYTLTLNTYGDSSWNETDLVNRFNSEICNDYGNLISRVLHLIETKRPEGDICEFENPQSDISLHTSKEYVLITELWSQFKIKEAIAATNSLVNYGNKYINDTKPWSSLAYLEILGNMYHFIRRLNSLYYPVFPHRTSGIRNAIASQRKAILFNKITS